MTKPLILSECRQCGLIVFPRLALCPRCAARDWAEEVSAVGVVEQLTHVRTRAADTQVTTASVRTDAGPVVIARLAGSVKAPGVRVTLSREEGVPVARPLLSDARSVEGGR
jgi:uncharacterized OB-fold protein